MSVALAISTAALVQSEIAQQEAHAARVASCNTLQHLFNAQTATIEQKQEYADCVGVLYPEHNALTHGELLLLRATIILVVVAALVVAYCLRKPYYDWPEKIMGVLFAMFVAAFTPRIIYGIYLLLKLAF